MDILAKIFIGIVIAIHLYIVYLEMFAWNSLGRKTFGKLIPKEVFHHTKKMAANQGLYNFFLAAGLIWTFFIKDPVWQQNISIFFLSCVVLAGLYGGITVHKKIFTIQLAPAGIALLIIFINESHLILGN